MNFDIPKTPRGLNPKKAMLGATLLLGLVFLAFIVVIASQPQSASATTIAFNQCNNRGAGPGGAPLTVTCNVSIINNITPSGNTSTATFSRTCTLNPCTGGSIAASDVVNAVNQCNASDNVGGSVMICHVTIVNNISADVPIPATALNVNQCIGSGGGGGANMSGCIAVAQGSPQVTQCNGSGNGGGATMICTTSGTTSNLFPVTVNQCNGSENGGGSFVTCTVSITNNITQAPTPTDTPLPATATQIAAATATQAAVATATQAAQATATQAAAATATQIATATQAAQATATQIAAATATQAAQATATQAAIATATQAAPATATQAAIATATQAAQATSTQVAAATATQVAAATATQAAVATATRQAEITATITVFQSATETATPQSAQPPRAPVDTGGVLPPSAGDAGLLQRKHSDNAWVPFALGALFLLGAIILMRKQFIRR